MKLKRLKGIIAQTSHQFFASCTSSKLSNRKINASQKAVNIKMVSMATETTRFWLRGNLTR